MSAVAFLLLCVLNCTVFSTLSAVCCLLAGFVDPGPANLVALTEGIHSKEALELVREHMLGVMGAAASNKFSTELIKMSKFQMAQVRERERKSEAGREE